MRSVCKQEITGAAVNRMNNSYLIKVDIDTTNVRSTNRNHAKESMFPTSEKSNTFIENEEVFQPLCHEGRNGEQFALCLLMSIREDKEMRSLHTNEMPPLLDYPCRRTMESMVISGSKIDNSEKERIPGSNILMDTRGI